MCFPQSLVIGETAVRVFGERGSAVVPWGCRWGDCPMGRLLNEALL